MFELSWSFEVTMLASLSAEWLRLARCALGGGCGRAVQQAGGAEAEGSMPAGDVCASEASAFAPVSTSFTQEVFWALQLCRFENFRASFDLVQSLNIPPQRGPR